MPMCRSFRRREMPFLLPRGRAYECRSGGIAEGLFCKLLSQNVVPDRIAPSGKGCVTPIQQRRSSRQQRPFELFGRPGFTTRPYLTRWFQKGIAANMSGMLLPGRNIADLSRRLPTGSLRAAAYAELIAIVADCCFRGACWLGAVCCAKGARLSRSRLPYTMLCRSRSLYPETLVRSVSVWRLVSASRTVPFGASSWSSFCSSVPIS